MEWMPTVPSTDLREDGAGHHSLFLSFFNESKSKRTASLLPVAALSQAVHTTENSKSQHISLTDTSKWEKSVTSMVHYSPQESTPKSL